jgi:uncharacterized OB-fold protein
MVGRTEVGSVLPHRATPYLNDDNRAFWTGGREGTLFIHRCQTCAKWIHPAAPVCRYCHSLDVAPQPVSGSARLATFTVNTQPWIPGAAPYIVGWAELVEQPGLILTTNLVELDSADVEIGMRLQVVFEKDPVHDIWFPLFGPEEGDQ